MKKDRNINEFQKVIEQQLKIFRWAKQEREARGETTEHEDKYIKEYETTLFNIKAFKRGLI